MSCKSCGKQSNSNKSCSNNSDWFCPSFTSEEDCCNCSTAEASSKASIADLYTCAESIDSCDSKSKCDSSSSSSDSSDCCNSDSDDLCDFGLKTFQKPRKANAEPIRKYEKYSGPEIFGHYRGAVVNVVGKAFLSPTGSDPAYYAGNGFLITKKHFVVCAAHLVTLAPVVAGTRVPTPPPNQIVPVNEIYVTVFNVNHNEVSKVGRNVKSITYTARLIGVDGAGDIAVLKINDGEHKIKACHPYFKFGCSAKYSPGNKVYSIGTQFGQDFLAVTDGVVRNNKMLNQEGLLNYEVFATTLPYNARANFDLLPPFTPFVRNLIAPDGAPILDVTGHVVGMVTTAYSTDAFDIGTAPGDVIIDDYALGVSERFLKHVVKALIKSYCTGSERHNTRLVTDPGLTGAGGVAPLTFYRYYKGYIGTGFTVVDTLFYAGLVNGATGATGTTCRQIIGVVTRPGYTGTFGFTGPTGAIGFTGGSIGDVITHIDCIEIGNLYDQLPLGTFTWRRVAGENAKLTYRLASSQYNTATEARITFVDYPPDQDYSPQYFNNTAYPSI